MAGRRAAGSVPCGGRGSHPGGAGSARAEKGRGADSAGPRGSRDGTGARGPQRPPDDLLPTEPGWRAEAAQLRAVAGRSGSLAVAAAIASAKVTGGVLGTAVRTANTNPRGERTTPPASSRKPTDPYTRFSRITAGLGAGPSEDREGSSIPLFSNPS